ncbi:unnamed protein product [Staurois parvus]|uniref:Transcriptional adapter 1 n=1 Tax=Staurois parvus TaxID=386267 RepID=A0ABN9DFV0_9NEOB|nr:unnamed protein product [Staurois parvus]
MATFVSELEAAKKSLSEALGENVKQYWANLKLWFKQKISKEEFDVEARRLLTQENVHSHNDFLLAILTRCQILISSPEGPSALGIAAKPGKPKGKKKIPSVRQKFDHRFQPQNPLAGAQQFVSRDPQEDDELKLCSHTMTLPTRGQLEGRMIVTAYEHGLDNVTEEAVTIVIHALEKHLKDLLTSVVSRDKPIASKTDTSDMLLAATLILNLTLGTVWQLTISLLNVPPHSPLPLETRTLELMYILMMLNSKLPSY